VIWHCRFRSLSGLGRLRSLRKLEVAGYPDASLALLCALGGASVDGPPAGSDLPGAAEQPDYSSAAQAGRASGLGPSIQAGRGRVVGPLDALPNLEEVNLFGVHPADRSVAVLWRIPTLRRARLAEPGARSSLSIELTDRCDQRDRAGSGPASTPGVSSNHGLHRSLPPSASAAGQTAGQVVGMQIVIPPGQSLAAATPTYRCLAPRPSGYEMRWRPCWPPAAQAGTPTSPGATTRPTSP
jgi:hypothetical protein